MNAIRTSLIFFLILITSGASSAALVARGDGLIYDTTQDITWYDPGAGYWMAFGEVEAFVNAFTLVRSSGQVISNWRLPSALAPDGSGPNIGYDDHTSELGHLYFESLGNIAYSPAFGDYWPWVDQRTLLGGPFMSLQKDEYWQSEFEVRNGLRYVSVFNFADGFQGMTRETSNHNYILLVADGDVANVIPEPNSMSLAFAALGTLLLGSRSFAKSRKGSAASHA